MNLKGITLIVKKPVPKVIFHSFIYMTVLKRQKYRNGKQNKGCQGLGMGPEEEREIKERCLWGRNRTVSW